MNLHDATVDGNILQQSQYDLHTASCTWQMLRGGKLL